MKTKFYSLVILALLTLFATMAWSANVVLKTDTETGDSYITIPAFGTDVLAVSAGVTFKVYCDGGPGGIYGATDDGYLQIIAPDGYTLQLNGDVRTTHEREDFLTVYDGDVGATKLLDSLSTISGTYGAAHSVASSGHIITLYFHSIGAGSSTHTGVDLTVSLNAPNKSISVVNSVSGGSVQVNKTQAAFGEIVTLTATPDAGYMLSGADIADESGLVLNVYADVDWNTNIATFVMPNTNVTVTPKFTNDFSKDGGLFVDMPKFGLKTVNVPAGVTSFSLYDDGGAGGTHGSNTDGYLVLTAPEGYGMAVSGYIHYYNADLTILDGDTSSTVRLFENRTGLVDVGTLGSSDNVLAFHFRNNSSNVNRGLLLEVTVFPFRTVSVVSLVSGGTAECHNQAVSGSTVSVKATPDAGYMLKGVDVKDESGNPLSVNVDVILDSNIARFVMPDMNISVTPKFTNDLTAAGGLYTNLPLTGTKTIQVPEGVSSFKVYDDGGKDGTYGYRTDGYLKLVAPEGYVLQVFGKIDIYDYYNTDYVEIFNGNLGVWEDNGVVDVAPIVTTSNVLKIYLHSTSSTTRRNTGIDFTVSIIDPNVSHTVTLSDGVTGGSVDIEPTSAVYGTTVSLDMTPSNGNLLDTVIVMAGDSPVQVSGGSWRTSNTATFSMPYSDVTVTPVFTGATAEAGASVNMPTNDWIDVNVPEEAASFKVYDDGGSNGNYSNSANGYLRLSAPEGFALLVTGSISTYNKSSDYFSIYDGNSTGATALLYRASGNSNIGSILSSGNKLLFYFRSDGGENAAGLDLKVSVINKSAVHTVSLSEGFSGGTVEVEPTSAIFGTTVTLTATPASGYLLKDFNVVSDNCPVEMTGGLWYAGSTATFAMPCSDVTVTPTFTNALTAEGGLSINMPVTGTLEANIPEGVTSFKVYDDGGVDGMYSNSAKGYLVLTAPEGYILQLEGNLSVSADQSDYFQIYDGNTTSSERLVSMYLLTSGPRNISAVKSTSNVVMVYFNTSNSGNGDGIDLTVTLLDATIAHSVSEEEGTLGGTISIPSSATVGTLVTVSASADEGYFLETVFVRDENGNDIPVDGGTWFDGNVATFTMPYSNVTVSPVFTKEKEIDELSLTIPYSGSEEFNIAPGIVSFKVYDDGGPTSGCYSCNGYMVLVAPQGYALQVTGTVTLDPSNDYLTIYNGNSETAPELLSQKTSPTMGKATDIGVVTSSGNALTLYLNSRTTYNFAGVDLTVSILPPHVVSVTPVQGGSVSSTASAVMNETVTLTAVPDEGYVLEGFTAYSNGNAIDIDFKKWANTATFVMPNGAVTVTPVFVPAVDLSVNMPVTGVDTVFVPEGVTSIKVYDDGGNEAKYSNNADGYLVLVAPEGRLLRMSGTVTTEGTGTDNLSVFDANNGAILLNSMASTSNGVATDIGTVWGLGNTLKLYFKSDKTVNFAGLDLTVTVEDASVPYTVSINTAEGGNMTANKESVSVGSIVTLTAASQPGYVLMGVSVVDENGAEVQVTGGRWYLGDSASFIMPSSNVVVTPVFSNALTAEGGLYIDMPKTGTTVVRIPEGVTSFKVYDDGGKDGPYSNNADGYLRLVSLEKYGLRLVSDVSNIANSDNLKFSNSDDDYWMQSSPLSSTDSVMKVHFYSDGITNADGFELTVTVIPYDSVVVVPADGGTITSDKFYAPSGSYITLVVSPNPGKILKGVTMESGDGTQMLYPSWFKDRRDTISFTMPNSSVTVTPVFVDFLTANDGVYINVPTYYYGTTDVVDVPEGITSFKVYDCGGQYGSYGSGARGGLQLNAPAGRILHLAGSMDTYRGYSSLNIYDGDRNAPKLLAGATGQRDDIELLSSGNTITIYFTSDNLSGIHNSGFDFTVTVIDVSEMYTIALSGEVTGGSVDFNNRASYRDTVTLTATPNTDYVLAGITAVDANGENIQLSGGTWLDNAAKFVMPFSDVTITPVFVTNATAEDGISINMPVSGTMPFTIPSGVISFSVYDDGGKDDRHSSGADGNLKLIAPVGYLLQITGNIDTYHSGDYLTIYDGDVSAPMLLEREYGTKNIGIITSTSNVLTINYKTSSGYPGIALKATLMDASVGHEVSVASANGGSLSSNETSATMGTQITLTATPDDGYVLSNVIVLDAQGNKVPVTGGAWYSNNTASFEMPYSDVTVTPVFVTDVSGDNDFLVKIPVTGTTEVRIPEGVTTFKVYDDGGKNGDYSNNAEGYLELTAPAGRMMQLFGTVSTRSYDFPAVYDGIGSTVELYNGKAADERSGDETGMLISSGNTLTIYFSSNASGVSSGIEFTVHVLSLTEEHSVVVADGITNGAITFDPVSGVVGTPVSMTIEPASGYMLSQIVAVNEYGENVKINRTSSFDRTCQFEMSNSDVTVTPTFTNNLTAEEGIFANIPSTGAKTITIPSGVTSFKVYDDGGNDPYSHNANGFLTLIAPAGQLLQISGTVSTNGRSDLLYVYDGADSSSAKLLNGKWGAYSTDIGTLTSTGNAVTLYFKSDDSGNDSGCDLTVSFVPQTTTYAVSLSDGFTGGTVSINPASAHYGDTVTLTATPDANYVLVGMSATSDGADIPVTGGTWLNNVVKFVMPLSDVTITPEFLTNATADNESIYINMPRTGMQSVTVPAGVNSFKVYDNGGKNSVYSSNANGSLELIAPEGFVFQVSGSVETETVDYLSILDGTAELLGNTGGTVELEPLTSANGVITLNFVSDRSVNYAGIDLTITLEPSNEMHQVVVSSAENGSMESDKSEALVGSVVTLTANPDAGFVAMEDMVITGCGGSPVEFTGGWYTGNQITFIMPGCDVTVTPSFGNEYFIDLPKSGKKTVYVPEGISSFKVYDEGGKNGDYDKNTKGYLELVAPENYMAHVSGTFTISYYDSLVVYDGSTQMDLYRGFGSRTTDLWSETNVVGFYLRSISSAGSEGLDIAVTLHEKTSTHEVVVADGVSGGSVEIDPVMASLRDTVTLTAISDEGYYLSGIDAIDENGDTLVVTDGWWFTSNVAKFAMPFANVTVTPHFVQGSMTDDARYINMPVMGRKIVNIPANVSSFKVYDDGGAEGNYSNSADGELLLIAPENCVLLIEGDVSVPNYNSDRLAIYDGDSVLSGNQILSTTATFESQRSLDNVALLNFYTDASNNSDGIDLTVTVKNASEADEITVSEGGSVNMPWRGTILANIPDGVTTFHVYDDGGVDGNYSNRANGYLVLSAPEGSLLRIGGNLATGEVRDSLTIFDGDKASTRLLDKAYGTEEIGPLTSVGNVMTFYFASDYSNVGTGFDFEIEVIDAATPHTVTVASVDNGNVELVGENRFYFGDTVTLATTPDNGYLLKNITVDANGNVVDVVKEEIQADGSVVVKFAMPEVDVDVSAVFGASVTADDGVYVTTPVSGYKRVAIPANIQSFKIYDDGGKDGNYSLDATGLLELTVPMGYTLVITGTAIMHTERSNGCSGDYCYTRLNINNGKIEAQESSLYSRSASGTPNPNTVDVGTLTSSGNVVTVNFHTNGSGSAAGLDLTATLVYAGLNYHVTFDVSPVNNENDVYLVLAHGDLWKNGNLEKVMNSEENGAFLHLYRYFEDGDGIPGFDSYKWSPVLEEDEDDEAILASYNLTPAIMATASSNEDLLSINLYPSRAGQHSSVTFDELPVYAYVDGNRVQELLDYHGKLVLSQTLGGKNYTQESFSTWAADGDDVDHQALYIPRSVEYGDTLVYDVSTMPDPGYVMFIDGFVDEWLGPTGGDVQDPPAGEGWGYDAAARTLKIAPDFMPNMEFKVRYQLKTYNVTFEVPSSNSGVFVANEVANNVVAMNWFDSYTDVTMMDAPAPAVYNANGCRVAWKVKGRNVENREGYELVGEIPFMVSTMDDASAVNALELDLQHPVCLNVDDGTGPTYLQTLQMEEGNGQLMLVQVVGDTVINHEFVNGQMTVPVHASDATKQEVGVTLKVVAMPDPGYVLKQLTYDMVVDGNNITALVEDGASVNVKQNLTWHVKFSNYEPVFITYDLSLGAEDSSYVWLPANAVAEGAVNISYDGSATDMWKPYRTDKCFAGWATDPTNSDFIFTSLDTTNIQMLSKDATNPTTLYAVWQNYGNNCSSPSSYVEIYPQGLNDATRYFTDTLMVMQRFGDVVFTHKDIGYTVGMTPNGYDVMFRYLPEYGHEIEEDAAIHVSSNAGSVPGQSGQYNIGSDESVNQYYVGVNDVTEYKVVLSTNAGNAPVFYGENWNTSAMLHVGDGTPKNGVFRNDACLSGWSFDPDEPAESYFDYQNRSSLGISLLEQRADRLAAGLNVDTLYVKWDMTDPNCVETVTLSLSDEIRSIATVTLYQEVDGIEVVALKIDSNSVQIPVGVQSFNGYNYDNDYVRFTRAEVTANPGATLSDTYQLSYVTRSDNESHEFTRGITFEDDIEFQVNGVSRNTYRVAYNENAGDANVFYGEHWGAAEEVLLGYGLSSSLYRTDACLAGWSFGENAGAGYVYNTVDADFVNEFNTHVEGDAPVNLYAVWSNDGSTCVHPIQNFTVTLSNDLKGISTVELIQTVGGEPKVVATVGEDGISIPKMQATVMPNEGMTLVVGENGYFSGIRIVPATGYELVDGVNPSYKIGNADAVEVTDATPAWLITDATELSGAVASTGYTIAFNENAGNTNVFYPADWSETGSYNIVDNDGTVFPKLYRTDKCLVGYGFNKDASRDQSFQKFDTTFVMAYDSVVAAGVASPVLYGVWNECTQALYKITLNDIAEGTLVLSHNGKAYNVPSTGFVVPEATPALEFGLAFTPNLGYKLSDEGSFNLVNESGVIQSVIENNTLAVDGDKIVDAPVVTLENTFAFVTNAGDAVLFYGDDWVESALYSLDAQNVDFPKGIYRVDSCFKGWALNTESDRTHLQFNTEFLDDVEATRNAGLPVDRLYAIWGACETEQTIVTVANADALSGTFTLSRTVSNTVKTYTVAGTALQVPADEALAFVVTFVPNNGYTYDETVGITAVDATDVPVSMNAGELVVATSLTLSAAATADTYTFALNENAGDANVFYTGSLATEFTAKVIDDAATRALPMNLYRSDACLEGWNFSATAMAGFSQLDDEFVDAYNAYVAAGNEAPTTLYAVWNENCHQTLYTVSSFDKRKGTLTLAQGSREFVVDTAGLKVPSVAGGLSFTATFTPAVGYDYDAAQGLEAYNNMSQSMGVLTDGALTVTKTTVIKAVSLTASTYELAFNVDAGNATVYYGDAWRAGTEQTSFTLANAGSFPSDIYRTDSCLAGWTLSTSATAGVFTEFSGEFVDSVATMDNFDGKLFAKWGNCIAVNNVTVAQVTSAAGTLTLKQTDALGNVLNTINIDDAEVTLPLGDGDVTFDVSFTVGEGYSLVDGDYFYTVNANGKNVQALLGNKLTLSGNTLLRAPILSDAYTITFNTNAGDANVFYGASWISEGQFSMEMNEVARTFPTEVYRVGYTLAGWSLNPADNSGDYVFDTDLATALKESGKTQVTLYAVWTAATSQQTYTITLADAAAGYLTASQTVDKTTATFRVGEEGLEVPAVTGGLTFSVKSTMNAGYFADGEKLYLLAAGGARIDSLAGDNGVLVVDADKVVEIPYESDGVEFVFNENTDAHVFYEDGWTGSGAFALNGDTAFPTGILRTEGKLLGWALSRTSTKYYTAYNGTFVNDLKNYKALGLPTGTLYAVWSEYGLFDNVNVTNGNQKNGSFVITQTVNGVETEPIMVNANGIMIPYSANGLTFNVKFETKPGYSLNAEQAISGANAAGTSIGSAVNGGSLVFKSNTDVVLSASVDADRFKFDYNVNGGDAYVFYGTDWSGADDKSLNDTSVVFPTNIYRNDACLLGWSVDPADTVGSKILTSDFIATLDRVQNVNTLYAVWKECEVETYTVTFANTNVGSLVLSQDVDDTLVTFPVEEEGLEVPVVPGGLRFRAAYTLKAGYAGNTDTLYVVDDISGLLTTLADNALTVNENIVLAIPTVGETFKLVFDVNREGRLFYGSDWIDSAIYMLSDKKSVIPLPNYVYTSGACMVGWSMDSTGGDTYLKFNTDLAAALLENKSADSTYKLYAIWGEGADCDDLYDRITLTSKNGTVHLAEAPRGDKTEFIEHEFMSDGTMILPKTMNGNYIRVFAVPDSSFMLDSLVMTREGSDGERQVFFEGDALVYNLMDAKFEAFFGKSNRTEVAFVGAEVIKLGNAIRFAFGTSEFEVTRKVAVSVRLETIDGELVAEDTVIDSIPRPYNGEWDKFPLAAGKYVLTATIGDESESDEFVETFEVEAEIATVSEEAWQIISIGNLDKDAMVWDDDARFYWWDETSGSGDYWQYKEFNPEDEIVPTRGYWYSSLEGRPLVLKPESDIEVADKVEWKLDSVSSGWNLVANPYGFALDLFADHPAEKADQTDSSGVTFWRWDANIADYVPAFIVQPYEAVWVKVSAPTDWTIPVAPQFDTDVTDSTVDEDSTDDATLKAISKARRLTKANGKNDWRLQMVLSDTRGHKDSWNMLGASHNAFTTEEPPEGMGDHVKLSIVDGNRMLAKSVKAPADEQDWTIALSANTERYGELSFKGVDDINALGLKVFVTVDGKTTEMHDGMPLRVLLKPGATVAKVHVGAGMKVVASASLNSLRALQSGTIMNVSFEASDNLAGSRTIVELVNMDGKVVASRNASAVAGMNQVALDAPKPGIYMLRVRAGSQMRAGRVLVR